MNIHGFSKLTLLDYPGHIACTVFTGACNFRCPFCHNGALVLRPESVPAIPEEKVLKTLSERCGRLEGVCITGGEPTLQADLPEFIRKVRALGYLVKLDTNGTRPDMVELLMRDRLVDYIAMDIKSGKTGYSAATGWVKPELSAIDSTVKLLLGSDISYEFRTTVVSELHDEDTFREIGPWIRGAKVYYLQQFRQSEDLIGSGMTPPSYDELKKFREIVLPYVPGTRIRGISG